MRKEFNVSYRKIQRHISFCIFCLSFFVLISAVKAEASSVVTVLSNTGTAMRNVEVRAYNTGGSLLSTVYTDTSGRAVFSISDGIQARFKILNYNCFTYDSGLVATPADLTVNLPAPSTITVLNNSAGVNGAFVYVYSSGGQTLGMVRTDPQGKAPLYLAGGLSFRFTVKYNGFTSFESALVTAPYDANVQLPVPTPITVLNQGAGVSGVTVYAYDAADVSYGNGPTNSSGLINCYIKEGIQIKFVIKYGGFIAGESAFMGTPSSVTLNLSQPSSVTVFDGITPLSGVRVYAYDNANKELGYNNTNAQGIVTCYLAESKLVKFKFQYLDIFYESSLLLTPVDHTVNLAPASTATVLDAGIGVPGIEVSAYDSGSNFLTTGVTDPSGAAVLHVSSGTQFTYSFGYKGYSHASSILTAPSSSIVNLPLPSTVTVLDGGLGTPDVGIYVFDSSHVFITLEYTDESGAAYFYLTGGRQVTFEIFYRGFEYTSGLMTAPVTQTINLHPASTVTVSDGGTPLSDIFVYAYGDNGEGLASGYTDSSGVAVFYFEESKKIVFEAQYDSARYFSEWITAPGSGLIDVSSPVKPASICGVKVEGNGLIVDTSPYKIKGIAYQPTPRGVVPWASNWANDARIFDRDFPVLTGINVNTIRTWSRVTSTLMDSAAQYGIKVIAGYWIDPAVDYSDPTQRANIKADFKSYVAQFKNKPALLFWAIGNAQNRDVPLNKLPYWYSLVNEMAYEAFTEERLFYHPVAVVNDSLGFVGDPTVGSDDAAMKYLDIWGTEVLTGATFGGYFDAYSILSTKPLWIAAYGVDAYDNNTGLEDQATQASWLGQSAMEIINSQLTIGGTLNEYSDEY
ncbi:MAG: hypothetical protein Q8R48_03445, partial [Candidatus Omnitrophota bacterium]|nr:hypothetical protein [Candidatus Omnitrophota bacterium]